MDGSSRPAEFKRASSWSVVDIPNGVGTGAEAEVSDGSEGQVIRLSIGEPEVVQLVMVPEVASEIIYWLQRAISDCHSVVARGEVVRRV